MPIRSTWLCGFVMFWAAPCLWAQSEEQSDERSGKYAVSLKGDPIDPRHRFSDDLTKFPARYYVWYDEEGWHLRSTTPKNVFRFTGKITVDGGTFRRLRTAGFERRGRVADSARTSSDRTEVEFTIRTGNSFDGIDFTIDGDDATVTFEDLKIGNRVYRNRIFVGQEGRHPKETTFSFPAQP